ncbi:GIY-YIG nuclease family protein [Aquidulcibacter sp.]|uniref:GIY-YIG nuclease family protein n=1 Tax=Aquidulcibacter sp. TaxID=2052990 RepID=UPI0025B89B01|nr:GIY-YIG nuclease family protein [Aquidulcibacter sp.]MCA3064722.1 GIY-YIG nuclease family protein [Rhodocyclaceae bacterium]MCA3694277.1 GIY-YIG nuclease family protein [Aquidulcibacter sp.]
MVEKGLIYTTSFSPRSVETQHRRVMEIRPNRWHLFELLTMDSPLLPTCAGVYVVYFDDELVYVGSSNNVRKRLHEHKFKYGYANNFRSSWGVATESTRVFVKVKPSSRVGQWAMDEIRLINRLRPKGNTIFSAVKIKKAA